MLQAALSRRKYVAGAFASLATMSGGFSTGSAGGARSGPWCLDLSKIARTGIYDFSLKLLDAKGSDIFTLSDLAGKPVWLNFFASWCAPCNAEAGNIVRLAAKFHDALTVVGIDVEEEPAPVRQFRDKHRINYPIALDSTASVFDALGFKYMPTHMFLGAHGAVSCISVGDLTPKQMDNEIAVALAQVVSPKTQ